MTSQDVTRTRWRAASPDELLWAHWGGDYVLFHRASGLTHLVNGATVALLREVMATPRTVEDAGHELAAVLGADPAADYVCQIWVLIQRLEALGLVRRVAA